MSSYEAREELADILTGELLGPTPDSPQEQREEVLDISPDSRYLIGRIAPVKLAGSPKDTTPVTTGDDEGDVLGVDADALLSRGTPEASGEDDAADAEGDAAIAEDAPIKRGLMIPASMGLRFQIPDDLTGFRVTATWGSYRPEKGEPSPDRPDARPPTRYRRTPHEHHVDIAVANLTPGRTAPYALEHSVVLRVDVHHDERLGRRLVEIALCNDRETPRRIPTEAWMYQTKLEVDAGGAPMFLPVTDPLTDDSAEPDQEVRRLQLQYRDRLEFAIGRTCSADWTVPHAEPNDPTPRRATAVRTTWLPTAATPQVQAEAVPGAELDMQALATASPAALEAGLRPIVSAYEVWLDDRETEAADLPDHLRDEGLEAVAEARQVAAQLADGVDYLLSPDHEEARRCFAFMNHVMAEQRLQTQVIDLRKEEPALTPAEARARIEERAAAGRLVHRWRMFQLAFVLMQLRALNEPETTRRSGDLAKVELLFFPTGGGKTEAYLGLAAYAFAIRRRQGVLATPDGPLDGRDGVTVLMRYTLRLLTAQQFQRAATLVCAAELTRQADEDTWGTVPFRIGLWVGTDVSPKRVKEAASELKRANSQQGAGHRLTLLQVKRCPWCGTPIGANQVRIDEAEGRVRVYCGDDLRRCPFALQRSFTEGLPLLTVDEEIYRLTPAFVIATVDKFARLAREGAAAALFGHVATRCARHGYVHVDDESCKLTSGSHPKTSDPRLPQASVHPTTRLRPPDLIIQDELHLITGALGTTVGLFEVAVETLTNWRTPAGQIAKPLIIASSATVRNARDQVRALYGRGVTFFPPQVLDAASTFFSREIPVTAETPGRRYVGVSTTGVRLPSAEIRVASVLMAAAQQLLDTRGNDADPYCTLVGYFNATRELAGMTRYLGDDVTTALRTGLPGSALPRRYGTNFSSGLNSAELTARVSNSDITATLDELAISFDPDFDSTAGRIALGKLRAAGGEPPRRKTRPPFDAVLATSMLQVGVDVQRLGLMLIVGQPKNTAEYIQASSRVGRDSGRPGLVVTLGNWARPRDLAHFEQFRHYHETFYASVEPLSVTPFSATSLDRGLDGVLVSAARVLQAARLPQEQGLSPETSAGRVVEQRPFLEELIDALVARVERSAGEDATRYARERLTNRLAQWEARRAALLDAGLGLVYERTSDTSRFQTLIRGPESQARTNTAPGGLSQAPFVVANSMREVQPEINLLVSPNEDRLYYVEPTDAPEWAPRHILDED